MNIIINPIWYGIWFGGVTPLHRIWSGDVTSGTESDLALLSLHSNRPDSVLLPPLVWNLIWRCHPTVQNLIVCCLPRYRIWFGAVPHSTESDSMPLVRHFRVKYLNNSNPYEWLIFLTLYDGNVISYQQCETGVWTRRMGVLCLLKKKNIKILTHFC